LAHNAAALASPGAQEILERVKAAGLRGRGGGWFPTAEKWRAVRVEGGNPLVVANGAEGEPGSIKDRYVMMTRPLDLIEGIRLAAMAVGAREAVVFLKASFDAAARTLQAALVQSPPAGLDVRIRRGDDSYVAGEETAILEVLEGRRPWPRPKPPYPAAVGFEGRPTLVQNVETLARVPAAVADPEAFRRTEPTLVTVWGHVARPGVYEVPLGTPVREIVDRLGMGAPRGIGLVFPGGPSTPPLLADALETPFSPEALKAAGSGAGASTMAVLDASANPLSVAVPVSRFFEREACGQCPPCTIGTQSLARIASAVHGGTARAQDLVDLRDVGGFMQDHGYCAHCRTAAHVVSGLLARPRSDGAVGAFPDVFASGSPERLAIEDVLARLVEETPSPA